MIIIVIIIILSIQRIYESRGDGTQKLFIKIMSRKLNLHAAQTPIESYFSICRKHKVN